MTQNTTKNILHWTDKHTQFSLKYKLGRVCGNLWNWILTLKREANGLIELSLKDFQEYVEKYQGKAHTFHYVKQQFHKLVFLRIVHIEKSFDNCKNSYRIQLRNPDAITPKKI